MKRRLFMLVLLAGLLLSACTVPTTYPAPRPLSLSGASYEASDTAPVAIDLDASGTSHIVRLECRTDDQNNCRVIYQAMSMGRQIAYQPWTPITGFTFRNPDIAVTDGGLAIAVWQNCEISTNSCSTWMLRSDNLIQAEVLDITTHSRGVPLVVSRGGVIYAVHEVTNASGGSALKFCLVVPTRDTCHWVSDHPDDTILRTDATAAVTLSGTLHVSYLIKTADDMTAFYADNVGDITKDMTDVLNHQLNMGTAHFDQNELFLPPAIALETDDGFFYIALVTRNLPSDILTVYYANPLNLMATAYIHDMNLAAVKEWDIPGRPSITGGPSNATIAFPAYTTDHLTQTDIYWVSYTANGTINAPSRPYPTDLTATYNDCDPLVTLVGGALALGWHICGFPPARDDIYFYSLTGGQIIHSTDWNGRGTLDMAANGELVAGVWNEIQPDGRTATWFAYNAHMLWLPVVKR